MSSKKSNKNHNENTIKRVKDDEDLFEENKDKKMGVFTLIIYLTVSIAIAFLAYYQLFKTDYSFMLEILKIDKSQLKAEKISTETKLTLVFFPWVLIALLFVIITIHIVSLRIFTARGDALRSSSNRVLDALNRALLNSLEQTFIFIGLYSFLIFKNKLTISEAIGFAIAFAVARFIYAFGYMIQGMTKFILIRATGMTITVFVNIVLVGQLFGVNLNSQFLKHIV